MMQQIKILRKRVNTSLFLHPIQVKADQINDCFSLALINFVPKGSILLMTQEKDGGKFFHQIITLQILPQSVETQVNLTYLDISRHLQKLDNIWTFCEKKLYYFILINRKENKILRILKCEAKG